VSGVTDPLVRVRDGGPSAAAEGGLRAKVEEFRIQKETVKAAYTAARVQASIAEAFSGISGEVGEADMAVRRAEDEAADLEARASALDDLLPPGALETGAAVMSDEQFQAQLDEISTRAEVEEELARCTSGIAYEAPTMPGSSTTLTTCCSERSAAGSGISARVANTTPGTRIRPCRGMTNRYGESSTISIRRHPLIPPVPAGQSRHKPALRCPGWPVGGQRDVLHDGAGGGEERALVAIAPPHQVQRAAAPASHLGDHSPAILVTDVITLHHQLVAGTRFHHCLLLPQDLIISWGNRDHELTATDAVAGKAMRSRPVTASPASVAGAITSWCGSLMQVASWHREPSR
jgi:hypothetical protein